MSPMNDMKFTTAGNYMKDQENASIVSDLTEEDIKALQYLGSSGEHTLEKTSSMYAGIEGIRSSIEKE